MLLILYAPSVFVCVRVCASVFVCFYLSICVGVSVSLYVRMCVHVCVRVYASVIVRKGSTNRSFHSVMYFHIALNCELSMDIKDKKGECWIPKVALSYQLAS